MLYLKNLDFYYSMYFTQEKALATWFCNYHQASEIILLNSVRSTKAIFIFESC